MICQHLTFRVLQHHFWLLHILYDGHTSSSAMVNISTSSSASSSIRKHVKFSIILKNLNLKPYFNVSIFKEELAYSAKNIFHILKNSSSANIRKHLQLHKRMLLNHIKFIDALVHKLDKCFII